MILVQIQSHLPELVLVHNMRSIHKIILS